MAKVLSLQLLPRVVFVGSYAMIGEIRLNLFHQSAQMDVYFFADEDARHQRLAEAEHELHRPVKVITVATNFQTYQDYIEEAARGLAAAGYKLITEVPAGASIEPRGLKELMEGAEDH